MLPRPLFIKPLYNPDKILFSKLLSAWGCELSFRSCNLEADVDRVYDWVNKPYALAFWQLDGPRSRVYDTYYAIQRSSDAHSFIGLLDGRPICQFDVYRVLADELRQYLPSASENDCGFHLLMAPNEKPMRGLTHALVLSILDFYFSYPEAMRMYGEPDIYNLRSNALLKRAGFTQIESIRMSYKTAHLYCITRGQFFHRSPMYSCQP